jgi:hypothetical protein
MTIAIGDKVHSWRVIAGPFTIKSKYCWKCRCKCGKIKMVWQYDLTSNKSRSCRPCAASRQCKTRKKRDRIELKTWYNLKRRWRDEIDPLWMDFDRFAKDIGHRPSRRHRLERIDPSLPFGPGNANWKEWGVGKLYAIEGIEYTLAELAFAYDIKRTTLRDRLQTMPPEKAVKLRVTSPKKPWRKKHAEPARYDPAQ